MKQGHGELCSHTEQFAGGVEVKQTGRPLQQDEQKGGAFALALAASSLQWSGMQKCQFGFVNLPLVSLLDTIFGYLLIYRGQVIYWAKGLVHALF